MVHWRVPIGRRSATLFALTLGIVVLADWLFYGQVIGWTAGLFVLALMGVLAVRQGGIASAIPGWILAMTLLALAAAMVLEPRGLSVLLVAIALPMWVLTERSGWTDSVRGWFVRALKTTLWTVRQPLHDGRVQRRWQRRDPTMRGHAISLRGWIIPVALTAVFVLMFRMANPIFSTWLDEAGTRISIAWEHLNNLTHPARIFLWMTVALMTWMLLRMRPKRGRRYLPKLTLPTPYPIVDRIITTTLVLRCLVLFNALFAVQTLLDVYYLWGGGVLPEGMTYAAYAHRGAYPLVATALMAAAFVMATFRTGGPAEQSAWARRLVYIWIGQNIFLVISAAWRLHLYVDVFSLTRWRIAAGVWMLLVAIGLGLIIWRFLRGRDNAWLLRMNILSTAMVLLILTFVNIEGFIAAFNVRRCAEVTGQGVPIDLAYLEHLGVAALPAVAWLNDQPLIPPATATRTARLQLDLQDQLQTQLQNWRGWTWRRHRLAARYLVDASP